MLPVFERGGGKHRVKITGVRWSESRNRKANNDVVNIIGKPKTTLKNAEKAGVNYRQNPKGSIVLNTDNDESRRFVESCYRTTTIMINPIVDWTDDEVWEFLHHYGCESNPLYHCGDKRIGCIGCPLSGAKNMQMDFKRYPRYYQAYLRTFEKMIEVRKAAGKPDSEMWNSGEAVMAWWLGL